MKPNPLYNRPVKQNKPYRCSYNWKQIILFYLKIKHKKCERSLKNKTLSPTLCSLARMLSERMRHGVCCGFCNFSSNSNKAKFFFKPHIPESPISVGWRSYGQSRVRPWRGRRVRHWWQTVWPHVSSLGTLSPWNRKISLHTRHSDIICGIQHAYSTLIISSAAPNKKWQPDYVQWWSTSKSNTESNVVKKNTRISS